MTETKSCLLRINKLFILGKWTVKMSPCEEKKEGMLVRLIFVYLFVHFLFGKRDLFRWPHWNNHFSPRRGGNLVHRQHLIDSPWRTLQAAERQIKVDLRKSTARDEAQRAKDETASCSSGFKWCKNRAAPPFISQCHLTFTVEGYLPLTTNWNHWSLSESVLDRTGVNGHWFAFPSFLFASFS